MITCNLRDAAELLQCPQALEPPFPLEVYLNGRLCVLLGTVSTAEACRNAFSKEDFLESVISYEHTWQA